MLRGVLGQERDVLCAPADQVVRAREVVAAAAGSTPRITMTSLIVHLWEPLGNIDEPSLSREHPDATISGIEVDAYGIPTASGDLRWLRLDGKRAPAPALRLAPQDLAGEPWRSFEPVVRSLIEGLSAKPCRIPWLLPADADAIPASEASLRASLQPHPDFERDVCPWIALSTPRWVVTRLGIGLAVESSPRRVGLNGTFDLDAKSACFAELDAYSRDE